MSLGRPISAEQGTRSFLINVRARSRASTHQTKDTRHASPKTMAAHDQFYEISLVPQVTASLKKNLP